jgi:histidinol-phosphate/aromatic aminotransferase/cobyric acid decarboxylase-like protein
MMNARDEDSQGAARRACIERAVRADVRAFARYPVAPADGFIKLDAMENPYGLPEAIRVKLGSALAQVPLNRYPDGDAAHAKDALRAALHLPPDVGLMLGNGSDELIQILTSAVATPGAVVLAPEPSFVMYRRNALVAHARFAGIPLRDDFRLDVTAILEAIARAVARARLACVSEQPDRQPVRRRRRRADHWCVACARRRRRGVLRVRRRLVPAARARVSQPRRRAHRIEDRACRPARRLRRRAPRLDRAVREGAAAVQREQPDAGRAAAAARAPPACSRSRPPAIRAERARLSAALARLPGVRTFATQQTNFVLAARPRRGRVVRDASRRAPSSSRTWMAGIRCLRIACASPSERRRRTTPSSRR